MGSNKTVAKIATDLGKPDGLVVVLPGTEADFLAPLPARALWGVGPKSEEALRRAGIQTIGDVASARPDLLQTTLGSRGPILQQMALGYDDRPVESTRGRKSVGAESTFPRDLPDGLELRRDLRRIAGEVAERLQRRGLRARTVVLKLRYSDFRTITRRRTRTQPTADAAEIAEAAEALVAATVTPGDRLRLLGIHCAGLSDGGGGQMTLWPDPTPLP